MEVNEGTGAELEGQSNDVGSADVETTDAGHEAEASGDGSSETPEPEYTPNFSYKVYDEEKEFPDWAKQLVKSKEIEDQLRTYLQKGEAFDPLKEKYERRGSEYQEVNTKYDSMINKLTEYDHYIKKGALGPVFKDWQISDQQVIDYVANLLKAQDDPNQRQQWEAQQSNVVNEWQTNQYQSQLLKQNQELARQNHEANYARVLSQPSVVEFSQKLESILGQGQMRSLADQYGQAYYQQHGRDTTPEDAVRYVMETYKGIVTMSPGNELAQAKAELEEGRPQGHLPRVGKGGAASPVKKVVRSLDDLRKLVANDYK